ncbi:MAG: enoyl-CoA hydratase/isomerase family protein, partial [Pseudomonadales bacterium]
MAEVIVRLSEGVGELVLNRPAQRNALTGPLVQELTRGLQSLQSDSSCSAVVVRGAERKRFRATLSHRDGALRAWLHE